MIGCEHCMKQFTWVKRIERLENDILKKQLKNETDENVAFGMKIKCESLAKCSLRDTATP